MLRDDAEHHHQQRSDAPPHPAAARHERAQRAHPDVVPGGAVIYNLARQAVTVEHLSAATPKACFDPLGPRGLGLNFEPLPPGGRRRAPRGPGLGSWGTRRPVRGRGLVVEGAPAPRLTARRLLPTLLSGAAHMGATSGRGAGARGFPTGTVTFLFTDLEGSTAAQQARPDVYRGAVHRHQHLLQGRSSGTGARCSRRWGTRCTRLRPLLTLTAGHGLPWATGALPGPRRRARGLLTG